MESHKDFFVDPCAPRRLVLSVPRCYTTKTSSHWHSLRTPKARVAHFGEPQPLGMTYSRFADAPLLFCITTKFHARRDDAQPSIYVYDQFEFYFSSTEGNGIERLWITSLKKRFINSLWLSLCTKSSFLQAFIVRSILFDTPSSNAFLKSSIFLSRSMRFLL